MNAARISTPRLFEHGGMAGACCAIEMGGCVHTVQYRVSEGPISTTADPFLAAALMPAMRSNADLDSKSEVSAALLDSIPRIQDIFHAWFPEFGIISLRAPAKQPANGIAKKEVGCFFTGGVDSFYTLLKHDREITKIIFVEGLNLPLEDMRLREKTVAAIRRVAERLGKKLIRVETNLRNFSDRYADYGDHYHGAALASVALLLAPQFWKIYIASTYPHSALHPLGSHPALDPLWSNGEVEIEHDGCEAERVEKAKQIADNPVVRTSLKVCDKVRNDDHNCGDCEKCLRTMVDLRAVGVLDQFSAFDRKLNIEKLVWVRFPNKRVRSYYAATLRYLERTGTDPVLADALSDMLGNVYYRGVSGWPKRAVNRMRRKLLRAWR